MNKYGTSVPPSSEEPGPTNRIPVSVLLSCPGRRHVALLQRPLDFKRMAQQRNDRASDSLLECRSLAFDITSDPSSKDLAAKLLAVTVHVYDAGCVCTASVKKDAPCAFDGKIQLIQDPEQELGKEGVDILQRVYLNIDKLGSEAAYIAITVSQRSPPVLLGQTSAATRPPLIVHLQAEIPSHSIPEEHSSALIQHPSQAAFVEVTLGTFDPEPEQLDATLYAKGTSELIAILACVNTTSERPRATGDWMLYPVREIRPLLLPKTLGDEILRIVHRIAHAPPGTAPYGKPLCLKSILEEIIQLPHSTEEIAEAVRTPRPAWDQMAHEKNIVKDRRTEDWRSVDESLSLQPAPPSTPAHSRDLSSKKVENIYKGERHIMRDMEGIMSLLKMESKDVADTAARIYAEPWKVSKSTAHGKKKARSEPSSKLRRQRKKSGKPNAYALDGSDTSVSTDQTDDDDASITTRLTRRQKRVLESFRKDLRKELLAALDNYATKDLVHPVQIMANNFSQVTAVKRDLQLILQNQAELESTIHSLAAKTTDVVHGPRPSEYLPWPATEGLRGSPLGDKGGMGKSPFVDEFVEFTRALEKVSQLTGSSFRQLQNALHYPEAFRELSTGATYPCARKLLEFVSSKQATALVENIETIAGIWRCAGTDVPRDAMGLGGHDVRSFSRKPWWTLRPFDYA